MICKIDMKPSNKLLKSGLMLLLLITAELLMAQPQIKEEHALKITGRSFGQAIKLRWAPTSMYAWQSSNESGYVLERSTIRKGNEILPLAERKKAKVLTARPLKPLAQGAAWKPIMERNDYAAIAAQALYGKSFSMTTDKNNLIAQKDEQTNRFSFGLFAADQSIEVAEILGLYFEDKSVVAGAYYLYKIYPAVAPKEFPVDTGYIYLGTDEVYELPKVIDVETEFGDKIVYISWDKTIFNQFYTSYTVERSTDGQNYEETNALPFVGMDKNANLNDRMLMIDSLQENDQVYYYRVRGKTIFEEKGPPSDPSNGMGMNAAVVHPSIESILNNQNASLGIGWEFLKENESEIVGFQLMRSISDKGPFEVLADENTIDKTLRYFIDENPLPVNYYKIAAVDKYGRILKSFAALAQLDDETPPAPPVEIRGTIMPDGEMVLSWTPNTEPDVMGYRVYMANRKDRAEYVQITSKAIQQNFYTYLVPMNTLSEEVFIKIRALDYRQNQSDFSEIATITRPDSIAPAAPIFTSARPTSKEVNVVWENSASVDVIRMDLERKNKKEDKWELINSMNYPEDINTKSHLDSTAKRGVIYQYRLKAVDDADLVTYSRIITAAKIDNGIRRPIDKINFNIDRRKKIIQLSWAYQPDGDNLSHFLIYRAVDGAKPSRYDSIKKVSAKLNENYWGYQDQSLQMDTGYQYQVRAVYKDGAQSPLSEKITVDF